MVEPRTKANLHKQLTKQEENRLDSIFSRQYERVVRNDFTIDHKKNCYQLDKIQPATICKRDIVTVEERMDQTIRFRLRGKYLNCKLLPEKPKKISVSKTQWVIAASSNYKPPANHPWRQTAQFEYLKKLTKVLR